MNTEGLWLPASALGLLYPAFVGYLLYSTRLLPERAAVHFSFRGHANGWMNRGLYLLIMLVIGTVVPLFPIMMTFIAKPRSNAAFLYMVAHTFWFGCMALGFIGGLHFLVVRANQSVPPRLSMLMVLLVAGAFAGGTILWEKALNRHLTGKVKHHATGRLIKPVFLRCGPGDFRAPWLPNRSPASKGTKNDTYENRDPGFGSS